MATYKKKNWSFTRGSLPENIQNGDVFEDCNFTQKEAHTKIFEDIENLTFLCCNLLNCDLPGSSQVEKSLVVQKSFCSHLHPEWDLTECPENCSHVIDIDEIRIDGELVDTIYHRQDKVVI